MLKREVFFYILVLICVTLEKTNKQRGKQKQKTNKMTASITNSQKKPLEINSLELKMFLLKL